MVLDLTSREISGNSFSFWFLIYCSMGDFFEYVLNVSHFFRYKDIFFAC